MTKKIVALLIVLASFYWLNQDDNTSSTLARIETNQSLQTPTAESKIASAYEQQISDIQVEGFGQVIKTLSDDHEGSRHQRFLLKLTSRQTILIAHNIDIAPKIDNLQVGDIVYFNGVYEWNPKGGVVHWTHHDPQSNHHSGWLELNGKRYQ